MKLRIETSAAGGVIMEYEGDDAMELAKLVCNVLVVHPSRERLEAAPLTPLAVKVLDWGTRPAAAIKVIRELWPGTTLEGAKKWLAVAPLVVGHTQRGAAIARLREAGVEVE